MSSTFQLTLAIIFPVPLEGNKVEVFMSKSTSNTALESVNVKSERIGVDLVNLGSERIGVDWLEKVEGVL